MIRSPIEKVELTPQPGLDEINTLIDEARALGTMVRFTVRGNVTQLADDTELEPGYIRAFAEILADDLEGKIGGVSGTPSWSSNSKTCTRY